MDAVYPYSEVDATGQTLTGANKYTVSFPKDATPPVNGFWSITMYGIDKGWRFVPNALNKFTVSPRNSCRVLSNEVKHRFPSLGYEKRHLN